LREAQIFHNMMLTEKTTRPALAVFYGKQAVNLLQHVRGQIQGLDPALQKSFLASKTEYYHDLAALLIQQGRLPEAQQVLDLLKQQEYSDYVRGDPTKTLSPLTLTLAEKQAQEDYQRSTAQIMELGEQWSALKKIATRTPEQEQQYQQLTGQLNAASKGLNDYYARLYTLFANNSDANKQVADVKGNVSLLKQTIAKMQHTVALYTLVGSERYSVIVITGSTAVAREYAITEKDLNQKVAAFQQALRDPHSDARPAAEELYKILIGPVKADLDQVQAQTLVWSLDGVLRYVPMAALYDGKQYVVEKYSIVTITPVSIAHLTEKPDFSNLSAAAMGISRKYEDALPALPAVAAELDEVVNDAQAKGAQGVLPGTILLNDAFTEKAMENLLSGPHTVVHIASHFVFQPGDDSQSYLLLAGRDQDAAGYHMTVAEFRDDQQLSLDETDLLTLSACETGMSGSASNGREVDGLGTTAQLKGAKAVISSLWEVNDASTGALMADFYKRWAESEGKVAKAEALREAQLDLLQGKVTPQSSVSGRGFGVTANESGGQGAPVGYSHPYYWAPFVLMGNWR
jgi:CHAT domain-containing protein